MKNDNFLVYETMCFSVFYSDTSVVPPLIYAVMGTSKDMVIGPVAVDSLLLSAMIQKLIIDDSRADLTSYKSLVFTATLFAGIFQAAFGIFRWVLFLLFIDTYILTFYIYIYIILYHSFLPISQVGISCRFFLPCC